MCQRDVKNLFLGDESAMFKSRRLGCEALEARLPLTAVPNFALPDVNPNSETYNQTVSPRDFMGSVSGWYFGHAT